MSALATRRVAVLSTGHVSRQTLEMLDSTPHNQWPVYGGPTPHGWYVSTMVDDPQGVPAELAFALGWLQAKGFEYVQFDCDADPIKDLPAFNHDAL